MYDFIACIIYLELSASISQPSTAQRQQNPLLSEFYADYKNQNNNDELRYAYHYFVDHPESMVHLHHQEERQGTTVKGEYGLLQPDGSVRNVYYSVDGSGGFRAIVRTRTAASSTHQRLHLQQQQPNKPIQHAQPVAFIN
ncbi:PREDICTED: larval cuticle protein A2B [Rhagoletis zephyria]|uniref:larval cuticle protein A2B n=1 Tax=Rhagoletis zephyria TaxID=28612 RepID=UPI00081155C5|nr:PREDICTED: larval cuticle protein A2B [Rhagoletis zephyria]